MIRTGLYATAACAAARVAISVAPMTRNGAGHWRGQTQRHGLAARYEASTLFLPASLRSRFVRFTASYTSA